jgi:hypothetical protein
MDDSPRFPRPTAKEVIIRIVAVDMIRARVDQEHALRHESAAGQQQVREAHSLVKKAADMMQPQKLFSPNEWELFYSPLGSWSDQSLVETGWRAESAGVLGWALGKIAQIPGYDAHFDVPEPGQLKALLGTEPPVLRADAEITEARDGAEMWNWRARTTILMAQGVKSPISKSFPEVISSAAHAFHKEGWLPPPISDDFPAFGKAYRDLNQKEAYIAYSIAGERHYAFNWLCGYGKDWDNVPTGT